MSGLTDPDEHVTMVLSDIYKQKEDAMKDETTLALVATIRVLNETIEHFDTCLMKNHLQVVALRCIAMIP